MARTKKISAKNWIYTPENFALDVPPALEPGVRWLLSTCYFYKVAVWKDRENGPDHHAYLSSDLLEKVVGRNVREVREAAIAAGLIECDRHYVPRAKCLGYRLGPALNGVKFVKWEGDGQVFKNRYRRFKDDWNDASSLDELGRHLRKWLCKVRISREVGGVLGEIAATNPDKAVRTRHQIEIIKAGLIKTKFCDYGRFTRTSRELPRKFGRRV